MFIKINNMSTFNKYILNFIIYYIFCILFTFGCIFQEEKESNEDYSIKNKIIMLVISPIETPIYLGQVTSYIVNH